MHRQGDSSYSVSLLLFYCMYTSDIIHEYCGWSHQKIRHTIGLNPPGRWKQQKGAINHVYRHHIFCILQLTVFPHELPQYTESTTALYSIWMQQLLKNEIFNMSICVRFGARVLLSCIILQTGAFRWSEQRSTVLYSCDVCGKHAGM